MCEIEIGHVQIQIRADAKPDDAIGTRGISRHFRDFDAVHQKRNRRRFCLAPSGGSSVAAIFASLSATHFQPGGADSWRAPAVVPNMTIRMAVAAVFIDFLSHSYSASRPAFCTKLCKLSAWPTPVINPSL